MCAANTGEPNRLSAAIPTAAAPENATTYSTHAALTRAVLAAGTAREAPRKRLTSSQTTASIATKASKTRGVGTPAYADKPGRSGTLAMSTARTVASPPRCHPFTNESRTDLPTAIPCTPATRRPHRHGGRRQNRRPPAGGGARSPRASRLRPGLTPSLVIAVRIADV